MRYLYNKKKVVQKSIEAVDQINLFDFEVGDF